MVALVRSRFYMIEFYQLHYGKGDLENCYGMDQRRREINTILHFGKNALVDDNFGI